MSTSHKIVILLFVFCFTNALPLNKANEATTPKDGSKDSIWTSWYMIVISALVPTTMILSVACCCCFRSKDETTEDTYLGNSYAAKTNARSNVAYSKESTQMVPGIHFHVT